MPAYACLDNLLAMTKKAVAKVVINLKECGKFS